MGATWGPAWLSGHGFRWPGGYCFHGSSARLGLFRRFRLVRPGTARWRVCVTTMGRAVVARDLSLPLRYSCRIGATAVAERGRASRGERPRISKSRSALRASSSASSNSRPPQRGRSPSRSKLGGTSNPVVSGRSAQHSGKLARACREGVGTNPNHEQTTPRPVSLLSRPRITLR